MSYRILSDLISIFTDHSQALLGVLLITIAGSAFCIGALKTIFNDQLTRMEYFSLGLAGWLLPAALISFLAFFIRSTLITRLIPILLPSLCLIAILYLLRRKTDPSTSSGQRLKPAPRFIDLLLPLILLLTIPARLLFVNGLVLPSYFDSVEHYARIQNIINLRSTTLFPSQIYYHIGYHFIAALIVAATQAPIGATMLILGQWLLAVMPLSVFFLIRRSTGSDMVGLFAVVLSAFGWYMPAHASDWGKYPALMSLGLIPFVMSLAYLRATHDNLKYKQRLLLDIVIAISVIVSTLIHSRSIIVYGLLWVAWLIANWIEKFPAWLKLACLLIACIGIVVEGYVIYNQTLLAILFDPYLNAGVTITSLVLLLSLFAWRANSRLATTFLMAILLLCGSIFIPVKGLGGYSDLTALDRPFVEMILCLPLTLLGGLGLAGLLNMPLIRPAWQAWIGMVLIAGVLIHAFAQYSFQPSPCCIIIDNDDVTAIAWLNLHAPQDAQIGVAATAMNVLVSDRFEGLSGSDAGIWIAPLINRRIIPLPYDTGFDQPPTLDSICALGIKYLYIGERGFSFDRELLDHRPEWYANLLSMPAAQVYEVTGCGH